MGHHSQTGDRLPPSDVGVQGPLKLYDPSLVTSVCHSSLHSRNVEAQ